MAIKLKDPKQFQNNLAKQGHTQRSFAKEVKVSGPYMNQIINEERNAGPKVAKKICDGLKAEFDDIFFIESDCKSYQNKKIA